MLYSNNETTLSSRSLVTHTTGMTHLKVMVYAFLKRSKGHYSLFCFSVKECWWRSLHLQLDSYCSSGVQVVWIPSIIWTH